MQLIQGLGAQYVFNHRDPDCLKQIQENFKGVDIVLEMAASNNLTKDVHLMNPNGRIIVIGGGKSVEVDPVVIFGLGISIIGVRLSLLESKENEAIHASLYRSVENGALRPIVDREFPLAEAVTAHHAVKRSGSLGKIGLIP